jgi:hypothetical protein
MSNNASEKAPSRLLDGYMDDDECADQLRVRTITLAKWRWQRKGPPFIKLGRKILYDRVLVKNWVAAQAGLPR